MLGVTRGGPAARALRFGIAAASVLLSWGCQQVLGLHDRSQYVSGDAEAPDAESTGPVLGQCGPLRHPSAGCAACMDQKCCAQADACHSDSSCNLAHDCMLACGGDGACRARCAVFYNRTDPLLDVIACRESQCASECGYACGGLGYSVPGCDTCVAGSCCAAASTCAKNSECLKLELCFNNCLPGSTSCPTDCQTVHPAGVADYAPWLNCTQNTCGTACETGHGWECLDTPVRWPKPMGLGTISFSVTIVDLLSEKPYGNAHVKACGKLDLPCATPFDQGRTDAAGLVALTVPAGSEGFDGYLDITGGDNGGGSAIFPAIYYPVPPVISPGWRGRFQFVSEQDLPLLGAATGATIDPARGHFAANASDCNFTGAGGVSFSVDSADSETKVFYFVNGIPNISAMQTDARSPIGGFVNLPPKLALVSALSTAAGNKTMGTMTVNIRAGCFTTTSFPPIP